MSAASCSDFLERAPENALSPASFWQSESDAYLALTGKNCFIGGIRIDKAADPVPDDYIPRIAEEISYIDGPDGDQGHQPFLCPACRLRSGTAKNRCRRKQHSYE